MAQNYSDQRKTSWDLFKNGTVLRRKIMPHLPWLSTSPEIFATKRGGGRQTQITIFFWLKNILWLLEVMCLHRQQGLSCTPDTMQKTRKGSVSMEPQHLARGRSAGRSLNRFSEALLPKIKLKSNYWGKTHPSLASTHAGAHQVCTYPHVHSTPTEYSTHSQDD